MERLFLNPKYRGAFEQLGWSGFSDVFNALLPGYRRRGKMLVRPVMIPVNGREVPAFFKVYHHDRSGWSFCLRRSKAGREFDNYAAFECLGIPSAEPIACGEERDWSGRLNRAFIITRAVPDPRGLDDYIQARPPAAHRKLVLHQLAGIVARLHAARFFHYDLAWRNILVSVDPATAHPRLYLIDCPRGGFSRMRVCRKRLHDLATLDKSASRLCSRAERLRFLLLYLGKLRVDDETRNLVRACLGYRRERWPGR